MSKIILGEPLASQIRQEANAQGVDIEKYLESVLQHHRFHGQQAKVAAEAEWWSLQTDEVKSRYAGEFVAIHQQAVIDHDKDEDTLRKRIRSNFGKTAILLTPAEGSRHYRIVSTHMTR
jgi:F0F1-type ATP synthase membrane subunit b/b'